MTVLGQAGNNTYLGADESTQAQAEPLFASALGSSAKDIFWAENEGPIKLLKLPLGWQLTNSFSGDGGKWTLKSFRVIDCDEVELRIYCRGNDHSSINLSTFEHILAQPFEGPFRRVSGDEIALLQEIMGPLVGNNQYTNHNPLESRCAPDCHLAGVVVELLGGRPVLSVDGIFIEKNGKAGLRFRNSYARDGEHSLIFEILLQAPNREFEFFAAQLHAAMSQMEWN